MVKPLTGSAGQAAAIKTVSIQGRTDNRLDTRMAGRTGGLKPAAFDQQPEQPGFRRGR